MIQGIEEYDGKYDSMGQERERDTPARKIGSAEARGLEDRRHRLAAGNGRTSQIQANYGHRFTSSARAANLPSACCSTMGRHIRYGIENKPDLDRSPSRKSGLKGADHLLMLF